MREISSEKVSLCWSTVRKVVFGFLGCHLSLFAVAFFHSVRVNDSFVFHSTSKINQACWTDSSGHISDAVIGGILPNWKILFYHHRTVYIVHAAVALSSDVLFRKRRGFELAAWRSWNNCDHSSKRVASGALSPVKYQNEW